MTQPQKTTAKAKDPCGERPAIPTAPLWHMGWAHSGNKESFDLLQSSIDWLTCQGKRNQPFDKDSKEFMHDLFEAFATGGDRKGWPEAAELSRHYVNGKGVELEIDAEVYRTSVIVKDTMAAMKKCLAEIWKKRDQPVTLFSVHEAFFKSAHAKPLQGARDQSKQGELLPGGILLTEQSNGRLKNADNRFFLKSTTTSAPGGMARTVWRVDSIYDFEKFSVGHVTHIPLGGRILKLPDGLSEYLTRPHIGVAKAFDYNSTWSEVWKP
jgi:hypothetical protein